MKKNLFYLFLLVLMSCSVNNNPVNPIKFNGEPIILGDPFMYEHQGKYYLTGTYGTSNEGFPCYISNDMNNWEFKGMLWEKNESSWAKGAFWAPEVKFYNDKFYLTYSGLSKDTDGLLIALAVSDTPDGPFTDLHAPWFDFGFGAIDGHIFTDDDNQPYLFFSMNGVKDSYSFGITYGVKLADDLSRPLGDTVRLIEASQLWEKVNWNYNRCNEGPFVFKYKDTYYMTYSANHTFEPNYGIGYATAPSPLGDWTKAEENPIANKVPERNITGIGHNSILHTDRPDEMLIIYHTHADPEHPENQQRHANIGKLIINKQGNLLFHPDR
jgi:beta-xylosidase